MWRLSWGAGVGWSAPVAVEAMSVLADIVWRSGRVEEELNSHARCVFRWSASWELNVVRGINRQTH